MAAPAATPGDAGRRLRRIPRHPAAPRRRQSQQRAAPGFLQPVLRAWARTQENFFLGIPPQLVRGMSPHLQELLGYNIWPPFMGHVTASHPLKTLEPDYLNAVLAQQP